ncbi:hypothetical protein [Streptomyces xiamenensis]|uniref:hypothetical protein n=1 Tax=Streptomyces xiamenensis TaxID=408015 RepID=UPI0035E2B7F1
MTPRRRAILEIVCDGPYETVCRVPGSEVCTVYIHGATSPRAVHDAYRWLTRAYQCVPDLLPRQRVMVHNPAAQLIDAVITRDLVRTDPRYPLARVSPPEVPPTVLARIGQMIAANRTILRSIQHGAPLPYLCTPALDDALTVDVTGRLRLTETTRVLPGAPLHLPAGRRLDVTRHSHHAMVLRRMMLLEIRFGDRNPADLRQDPLFCQFLDDDGFAEVFRASRAAGEL